MLKKPVNGGADITKSGEQPSGINEGIIYGGIFQEDSTGGVVTLSLNPAASASAKQSACATKRGAQKRTTASQRRSRRSQNGANSGMW